MTRADRPLDGLDDDIRDHIERETQDNIDRGMSPEEARRQAMLRFGNVGLVKEDTRAVWVWLWLEELVQDSRYTVRTFRRSVGYAAVAVVTLALGVGANTAIFSIVNAVVLQPLPYPEAARLVAIYEQHPAPLTRTRLSAENFLDLQRQARSFDALGGYIGTGFTLSGRGDPEFVVGQMISAELLVALGVEPLFGRWFGPEENEGGRDQVLLLSHALWQRRYGADPAIVGQTITANGKPYTVIGVMPAGFAFPDKRYQLWVPFAFRDNAQGMVNRSSRFLQVVGRLRSGVAFDQAQAELTTLAHGLENAFPRENADTTLRMASLADETLGDARRGLLLLFGAVGFVLLIACANVTSLLLARASTRQREMALRTALGASRTRLVRQVLTETLVLYAAGACAGMLLAGWALGAFLALSPEDIPRLDQTRIDFTTLVFTLGVTLVTGVAFGLIPALQAANRAPGEQLKTVARSMTADRASRRARAALVAAEVALSLMLMVGAGLAARTLVNLQRIDTGLNADGVLTFNVVPPEASYPDGAGVRRFHRDVIERLSTQPGAAAVGATSHLPLSGQNIENSFTPEGWIPSSPDQNAVAGLRGCAGRYIEAIGARLTAGRAFTDADTSTSQRVAMINEEFARRYWPGQDPVGKRLKLGGTDSEEPWHVVVGVYADLKHMGPQRETRPEVMLPYAQVDDVWVTRWMRGLSVVIRTTADPLRLVSVARDAVRSVDPSVPLVEPRPMSALVADSLAQPRFRSTLLLGFAWLALLLALVGIYGVMAFMVEQRSNEISVRVALGARPGAVIGLILRQGAVPVVIGLAMGVAGALAVGRAMRGLLFNVEPTDPVTFTATSALFAAVALVACVVPARRALSVQPVTALRAE
jgi:putative ABC transport system permease protein